MAGDLGEYEQGEHHINVTNGKLKSAFAAAERSGFTDNVCIY